MQKLPIRIPRNYAPPLLAFPQDVLRNPRSIRYRVTFFHSCVAHSVEQGVANAVAGSSHPQEPPLLCGSLDDWTGCGAATMIAGTVERTVCGEPAGPGG